MRLSALLASLTLLTMLFAGCTGDDGGGDGNGDGASTSASDTASATGPSTSRSSTASSTGSSSGTGAKADTPPTGSITVAVNGTAATFELTGSDPDGDSLEWTLEFGDGASEEGSTLPATVDHAYAVGNYTANFTIMAGGETAEYGTTLTIEEAVAGGGAAKRTQEVSGGTLIPNPAATDFACLRDDVDGNIFDLDPAEPGWTYVVEPGDGTFGAFFWDGDSYIGGGTAATGTVPSGAGQIEVCNVTGEPMASYKVVMTEP